MLAKNIKPSTTNIEDSSFVISNKDRGESSEFFQNSIDSNANHMQIIDVDNVPSGGNDSRDDDENDSIESNIVDLEDISIKP